MNLIFDIGYNHGEFTQECFKKYPLCRVIGVEANEDLFYGSKKDKRLYMVHAAASDKDDSYVDFFVEPHQDGISTVSEDFMNNSRFCKGSKYLNPKSANWSRPVKTKTVTLSRLIKDHGTPDLIKVDVEGYEYEVLLGLTKKAHKICFECHEEEKKKLTRIVKHLYNIGYNEFGFIGYFEEGDVFEKITFSEHGDPYLVEPTEYFSWQELKKELDKCFIEDRRINYGMVWCR